MHRTSKELILFSKQFIASMLSVILLLNLVVPVWAQTAATAAEQHLQQNFDEIYSQELNRSFVRESVRVDDSFREQDMKLRDEYYSDPVVKKLLDLQEIFLSPQQQMQQFLNDRPVLSVQEQEIENKKQWKTQYEQEIAQEAQRSLAQMSKYEAEQRRLMQEYIAQARAANVSNRVINTWKEQEEQKLAEALEAYKSKVNAWRLTARKQADAIYRDVKKQQERQVHTELRQAAQELMALYQKYPQKAVPYVIEISAAVLLAEGRNTDLFTDSQKQLLRKLYVDVISHDQMCSQNVPDSFVISCKHIFNAVTSLGILGDTVEEENVIADFTSQLIETSNAVPGLLTGVSALLAMKAYGKVRGLVASATNKETDIDNLDILSVANWVEAALNRNGKYLGNVSKWAQFPITNEKHATAFSAVPNGNAWEEIAYMLAEEGSYASLEILRTYGIDRCRVAENKISCLAIEPFVVGAILSGKVNSYTGEIPMLQEGYVISSNGSHYVSKQGAENNLKRYQHSLAAMKQLANSHQISIPAEIIRSFYMSDMGDLNADDQLFLDQKLYQGFQKLTNNQQNIPEQFRIKPYTKDSDAYKAKARRAHRAYYWRLIGVVGDIAILVWCLYDLSKLGYKAVNMGRTAYRAAKMARAGQPVSARLALLWKSGTARSLTKFNRFPVRMKNAMTPAVRAALPQFVRTEPLVKPLNPAFLDVALSSVKIGEGGALTVNAAQVTEVLGDASNPARTADLQTALNAAVERANSAYANRSGFSRMLPENMWYRQQLGTEISKIALPAYQAGDGARLADFSYSLSHNKAIRVPENIRKASQIPLLDGRGAVNMTSLRMVLDPVLSTGSTSEQRADIMQAIQIARDQTGLEFAHRSRFSQWTGRLLHQDTKLYNELLSTNFLRLLDNNEILETFSADKKTAILRSLAATVHNYRNIAIPRDIAKYAVMEYSPVHNTYKTVHSSLFSASGETTALLPLEFRIDRGLSQTNRYQRVIFTEKGGRYTMGLTDGLSKPVNLSNFKIDIPSSNMPELIRGVYQSGASVPLEIKLTPYATQRAMRRAASISGEMADGLTTGTNWLRNAFKSVRNKANIWTDEIPVYIRSSVGHLLPVPMVIKADTQLGLAGSRLILNSNNNLRLMRAGENLSAGRLFHYSLPKQQISPLVNMMKAGAFDNMPLRLTIKAGRDKITPLFWTSGLSLSAASAGLITPLENTYRDRISEGEKVLITFAFPYLPSILSPAIAPFVMRFGAAKMLKIALGTAAAGLAFSSSMGFRGHLDQNNLPDPWPLFVMATGIGISSAISRSSLNILIDSMGGGGSLLKSMAYKNLGSIFLLAPSFLYGAYKLQLQPKLTGKTLTEKELNTPASDFSFAFPVLTGLSLGVLAWVSSARLDPNIGRASAVIQGKPFNLLKEMGPAFKMSYWSPEVLPLAAATTFFTGFESAAFSKGTNLSLKPIYENSDMVNNYVGGNRKNLTALLVGGTAALIPMGARFLAKPSLNALASPLKPGVEYKRMLGLSYALNATGGALLMKYGLEDNPSTRDMWLGIALMGLGTANVTQSFQKLANIRIATGPTMAKLTQGMDAVSAAQRVKEIQTMTMTGFSWSQIGIAMLPLLQGKYVDTERDLNYKAPQGPLNSLWIPMVSLGLSAGCAIYGLNLLRYPTGIIGTTKLAVDGPSFLNPVPYAQKLHTWHQEYTAGQMNSEVGQSLRFEQTKAEVQAEREKARHEVQEK